MRRSPLIWIALSLATLPVLVPYAALRVTRRVLREMRDERRSRMGRGTPSRGSGT